MPPELAESAQALWEQALRLSQQTAAHDDSAARVRLEELRRATDARARSQELREKEWDIAARVRERALTDAREQVNVLMKKLVLHRAELRARDARIADLEGQLEEHRRQLTTVIAGAISKKRAAATKKTPTLARVKPKTRTAALRSTRAPHENHITNKQAALQSQILNGTGTARSRTPRATSRARTSHAGHEPEGAKASPEGHAFARSRFRPCRGAVFCPSIIAGEQYEAVKDIVRVLVASHNHAGIIDAVGIGPVIVTDGRICARRLK